MLLKHVRKLHHRHHHHPQQSHITQPHPIVHQPQYQASAMSPSHQPQPHPHINLILHQHLHQSQMKLEQEIPTITTSRADIHQPLLEDTFKPARRLF